MDIFYVVLYAFLISFYYIFKKLAIKKSSEVTVLVMFTTVSFLLCLFYLPFGIAVPFDLLLILALKGFLISISWYLTFKVLKSVDLSIVTVTNILSAVLSFVLGIVLFSESAGVWQIVGSALVIFSVAGINLSNKSEKGSVSIKHFLMLLVIALISTSSNITDKYTTTYLTNFQVQFWFQFFACFFSWIYFAIECIKNKQFLMNKKDFKNPWVYLLGIFLIVADTFLYLAYKVPGSKMITISVLANLKMVITVVIGIFIFKEKNIFLKLLFSLLVVLGAIFISVF